MYGEQTHFGTGVKNADIGINNKQFIEPEIVLPSEPIPALDTPDRESAPNY